MASNTQSYFEDLLPIMADKLGGEGLIEELCKDPGSLLCSGLMRTAGTLDPLCNGFRLLMDGDKGIITFDSLKRNAALLGLQEFRDDDLRGMLREGDFDADGALNQMEFCVLMFRLSTELTEHSQFLLEEALQ